MPPGVLPKDLDRFRAALLRWYDAHRRNLPWRGISDPYRTWVSEVMLQQTRVAAVLGHYRRFVERFPTVRHLARARETAVLAAWSGLGYYRRARLLHQAARKIVGERAGRFPQRADEWGALPGIGRYTAAAIASIAFGEPTAVVDGNVQRILGRLFAMNGRGPAGDYWSAAEKLLSRQRPGDFNQAMMELGATVCLPGKPLCGACPIAPWCQQSCGTTASAVGAKARERRRLREIAYVLHRRNGSVRLRQRCASERLLPGMWELPPARASGLRAAAVLRHSITSTDYRVRVVEGAACDGLWIPVARLQRLPLTGLTKKILQHFQIIE